MIKKIITEALHEFFESPQGQRLIAKAVRTAMVYEVELEKHHRDDTIERVTKKADILTHIAAWIKKSEGAIRGCQQDVEKALTHSVNTRTAIEYMAENLPPKQITHENDR
jgi:hypothetical protein